MSTIPDADKLARYDDLANLVEELHDENMALRSQIYGQALHVARKAIAEERKSIVACCRNRTTGKFDNPHDAAVVAVYDGVINAIDIARKLKEYGIASKNLRVNYDVVKGFDHDQFKEAFARYLSLSPEVALRRYRSPVASTTGDE